jgi:hypothetical protein
VIPANQIAHLVVLLQSQYTEVLMYGNLHLRVFIVPEIVSEAGDMLTQTTERNGLSGDIHGLRGCIQRFMNSNEHPVIVKYQYVLVILKYGSPCHSLFEGFGWILFDRTSCIEVWKTVFSLVKIEVGYVRKFRLRTGS